MRQNQNMTGYSSPSTEQCRQARPVCQPPSATDKTETTDRGHSEKSYDRFSKHHRVEQDLMREEFDKADVYQDTNTDGVWHSADDECSPRLGRIGVAYF